MAVKIDGPATSGVPDNPSRLNWRRKSKRLLRFVLSITGRPTFPDSTVVKLRGGSECGRRIAKLGEIGIAVPDKMVSPAEAYVPVISPRGGRAAVSNSASGGVVCVVTVR